MRILITPKDNPDDAIRLIDGSPYNVNPWNRRPAAEAYLDANGLSGWYDSLQPETELSDIPGRNGAYMPGEFHSSARTVTIRGHRVRYLHSDDSSDVDDAMFRERLNALALREVTLTVMDPIGVHHADAFVSASIETQLDLGFMSFTIILSCPDPLKYGDPVSFPVSGGRVTVENLGNMPTYPIVTVQRAAGLSFISVTNSNGNEVAWEGDGTASNVTLDFRTLMPTVGRVTVDDVFTVGPGSDLIFVSADNGATSTVVVNPAWR